MKKKLDFWFQVYAHLIDLSPLAPRAPLGGRQASRGLWAQVTRISTDSWLAVSFFGKIGNVGFWAGNGGGN
jgi:hypothetical protein